MISRRQFLAFAPALAAAAPALAGQPEPKKIGHVERGQRTALQARGSEFENVIAPALQKMIELHDRGEARISLYDVEIRRATRTGSMRPGIGDNDLLLVEKAPYAVLSLGDIVEGRNDDAKYRAEMGDEWSAAHRIVGGRPGAWVTRGDNNQYRDPFPLTPTTYTGWRTIAVFHTFKPFTHEVAG